MAYVGFLNNVGVIFFIKRDYNVFSVGGSRYLYL